LSNNQYYNICHIRKRQSNAAAVGSNGEEVKTFTVPCKIDVQLDKATVCDNNDIIIINTVINNIKKSTYHTSPKKSPLSPLCDTSDNQIAP